VSEKLLLSRKDIDQPETPSTVDSDTLKSKFYYALRSIRFSDSTKVALSQDDVLVIVGGNNVGKSQALREIIAMLASRKKDA